MKLLLLAIGIIATGLGALVFFCLAIASSMAEENQLPPTDEP